MAPLVDEEGDVVATIDLSKVRPVYVVEDDVEAFRETACVGP